MIRGGGFGQAGGCAACRQVRGWMRAPAGALGEVGMDRRSEPYWEVGGPRAAKAGSGSR